MNFIVVLTSWLDFLYLCEASH